MAALGRCGVGKGERLAAGPAGARNMPSHARRGVRLCAKNGREEDEETAWGTYQKRSSSNGSRTNGHSNGLASSAPSSSPARTDVSNWDETWSRTAFPSYLHPSVDGEVEVEAESVAAPPHGMTSDMAEWDWGNVSGDEEYNPVWKSILEEAKKISQAEPLLSSFMYSSVLCQDSLEHALASVLASQMHDTTLHELMLFDTFLECLEDQDIRAAALLDMQVTKDRDPACKTYLDCLLHYHGFQALQVHRMAHALYAKGREVMASMLQSRCSEVYGVDIHPAAKIGNGILIDHATGVVIGETAVVGDYSSLLQGVTLGGTGKTLGDRHPKVGRHVLVGAQATVLGNITIGDGAMIAAGSMVLKSFPSNCMIAGNPAYIVRKTRGLRSQTMQQGGWEEGLKGVTLDQLHAQQREDWGDLEYFI